MIKFSAACLCILLLLVPGLTKSHVFYMSICEVKIKENRKDIDVKIRVFSDDLESALTRFKKTSAANVERTDENLLESYLRKVFMIYNGGELLELNLNHHSVDEDATIIRLETKSKSNLRSIRLRNHLLLELFDSQTNISKFYFEDTKKIENLNSRISSTTFTF